MTDNPAEFKKAPGRRLSNILVYVVSAENHDPFLDLAMDGIFVMEGYSELVSLTYRVIAERWIQGKNGKWPWLGRQAI
jgi:hypothetical protein